MGVLCLSMFCYTLLCVHFSFTIILKRKRKLVTMLLLSCRCFVTINVLWLFITVLLVGLQHLIVVFPDHTHLLWKPELFRLTSLWHAFIYTVVFVSLIFLLHSFVCLMFVIGRVSSVILFYFLTIDFISVLFQGRNGKPI